MEERLKSFLDERCVEADDSEAKEIKKKIYPEDEGTWIVSKDNLRNLLNKEITLAIAQRDEFLRKEVGEMKKQKTQHQIPCPDNMPGCLVYHCEERFSHEDEKINEALSDVLALLNSNKK